MVTPRVAVLWLIVAGGVALGVLSAPVQAEEGAADRRRLLEVARRDLPLATRLASAARALRAKADLDPELAVRAGASLLAEAPEPGAWLALRGADAGFLPREVRLETRTAIRAAWPAAQDDRARARLAALGWLLGEREMAYAEAMTAAWPPQDLVRAVLRREIGSLRSAAGSPVLAGDATGVRSALEASLPIAALLDTAVEDDPQRMREGLDGLLAKGGAAVPLLLHEAEQGVRGEPAGRMPRAARAILVLGMLKDRRATPVLARCLQSTYGWVRAAAATALGDLGDPAGAVALAVHISTPGDLFRARDQWDYPGKSETTVAEGDWARIDYFVVDGAAADSLLRLGVPNAAGYLIHQQLDPSRQHARIRVFQDARDALRRAMPELGADRYNVDAGLPLRDAVFADLARAWREKRDTLEPGPLEKDPGFRRAARELVANLRGTDVRTFMITKPACALLGRTVTPTLIETLEVATRGSARVALAETLGLVRDPRAIEPLLGMLKEDQAFVRARAAEALGTYVHEPRVREALIATLADPKAGPRISALKGLVGADPNPDVLAAVKKHRPAQPSQDWAMAESAVLLVQEGAAHWPPFEAGLAHEQRYVREAHWRMLRTALDWPAYMHDAKAKPDAPHVRRVTRESVLARLEARRAR
ncbi:MAG: HEAT repeat domain-containing protein [Planctomycetota bacterium]|nr:HEAT repeat domain-containing protein [Planctomycetota bacterium]